MNDSIEYADRSLHVADVREDSDSGSGWSVRVEAPIPYRPLPDGWISSEQFRRTMPRARPMIATAPWAGGHSSAMKVIEDALASSQASGLTTSSFLAEAIAAYTAGPFGMMEAVATLWGGARRLTTIARAGGRPHDRLSAHALWHTLRAVLSQLRAAVAKPWVRSAQDAVSEPPCPEAGPEEHAPARRRRGLVDDWADRFMAEVAAETTDYGARHPGLPTPAEILRPELLPKRPPKRRGSPTPEQPVANTAASRAPLAGAEPLDEAEHTHLRRAPKGEPEALPPLRKKTTHADIAGEQELDLIRRYQAGDRKAGEILLEAHDPIICRFARPYLSRGADNEDVLQEARMGFLRGVEKFDISTGHRLTTYATWWVRAAASRCLVDTGHLVRIPSHAQEAILSAKRAGATTGEEAQKLANEHGNSAAIAFEMMTRHSSLDTPIEDEDGRTFGDMIADDGPLPDELTAARDEYLKGIILAEELLDGLSARERMVIERSILAEEPENLQTIASSVGRSRERMRQIQEGALGKIRRRIEWKRSAHEDTL